jgi:hypothetical protein
VTRNDSVRVLYCHHTDPSYMPAPRLSERQVVCGPFCDDVADGASIRSLRTPKNLWDIREVLARLPAEQQPDLIVVKADASRQNFPTGFGDVEARKILLIGDTWHMYRPLSTMLTYARQEPFDLYVTEYMRRHAHFFLEAGVQDLFWIPGLALRTFGRPFPREREAHVSFVGQHGKHHPRRQRMIARLRQEGLPVLAGLAPQEEADRIYGESACTLNLSGNGDMNLRVFEVLAAGGCLLTDACRPESGFELLFRPDEHLVFWDGLDDLCDKVEQLLADPARALAIAHDGHRAFQRAHTPQRARQRLMELALYGWVEPLYDTRRDARSARLPHRDPAAFELAVSITECIQAIHRDLDRLRVTALPGADSALCADLIDLPRLMLTRVGTADRPRFREAGLDARLEWIESVADMGDTDVLIASTAELADPSLTARMDQLSPDVIVAHDIVRSEARPHAERAVRHLCGSGYRVDPEGMHTVFVHQRVWDTLPRMRPPGQEIGTAVDSDSQTLVTSEAAR